MAYQQIQTTHVTQITTPDVPLSIEDKSKLTMISFGHVLFGFLLVAFGITAASIDCYFGDTWLAVWMGAYIMLCAAWGTRATYANGYYIYICVRRYRVMNVVAFIKACCIIGTYSASLAYEYRIRYFVEANRQTRETIDATIITIACLEVFTALHGLKLCKLYIVKYQQNIPTRTIVDTVVTPQVPAYQHPAPYNQYGSLYSTPADYGQPGGYPAPQQGYGQAPPTGYVQPPPQYGNQPPSYGFKE